MTVSMKKLLSVLISGCFLFTSVGGQAVASVADNARATQQYKQIFADFMLPYSYGKITDAHFASTDRVIINIQDLHCHPKVQKNISNIIDLFDKKYGVKTVYLEGAYGDVDTSWITKTGDSNYRNTILEKMIDTGRLTGAEYFSAVSGKTGIIKGLEKKEPYLENLKRFGDILENKEKIELILKSIDKSTRDLKAKYYDRRQFKLEQLSKDYANGKINSEKYFILLSKHIEKLGIDIYKYDNTLTYMNLLGLQNNLKYTEITKELQNLVLLLKGKLPFNAYKMLLDSTDNFAQTDKLYGYIVKMTRQYNLDLSVNFPELNKYFGYVELSQKINPLDLIKEEKDLINEINTRFSSTKAQRDVVFMAKFEKYLGDYLTSKITKDDYEYYNANIAKYRQLWDKYVDNRVLHMLDGYMAEADKFYKINTDRNEYFTENITEGVVTGKIDAEISSSGEINKILENMSGVKRVDVIITGGFHTTSISDILDNQNVSYIVITPNVTDGTKYAEQTYYRIVKEQSKISFQALANLIASLSPIDQIKILNTVDPDGLRNSQYYKQNREQVEKILGQEGMLSQSQTDSIKELLEFIGYSTILESDDQGSVKDQIINLIKENLSKNSVLTPQVDEDLLKYIDIEKLSKALKEMTGAEEVIKQALAKKEFEKSVSLKQSLMVIEELVSGITKTIETLQKIPTVENLSIDNNVPIATENVVLDFLNAETKDVISSIVSLADVKEGKITADVLNVHSLQKLPGYAKLKEFFANNKQIALSLSAVFHNKGYYEPLAPGIADKTSTAIDTRLFDGTYVRAGETAEEALSRANALLDCLTDEMKQTIAGRYANPNKSFKIAIKDIKADRRAEFFNLAGKELSVDTINGLADKTVVGNTLQVPWEYLVADAEKYGDEESVNARKQFLIDKQIDGVIVAMVAIMSVVQLYELANSDTSTMTEAEIKKIQEAKEKLKTTDIKYVLSLIHAGWSANNSWSNLAFLKYPSTKEQEQLTEKDGFLSREEVLKDGEYFEAVVKALNLTGNPAIQKLFSQWSKVKTGESLFENVSVTDSTKLELPAVGRFADKLGLTQEKHPKLRAFLVALIETPVIALSAFVPSIKDKFFKAHNFDAGVESIVKASLESIVKISFAGTLIGTAVGIVSIITFILNPLSSILFLGLFTDLAIIAASSIVPHMNWNIKNPSMRLEIDGPNAEKYKTEINKNESADNPQKVNSFKNLVIKAVKKLSIPTIVASLPYIFTIIASIINPDINSILALGVSTLVSMAFHYVYNKFASPENAMSIVNDKSKVTIMDGYLAKGSYERDGSGNMIIDSVAVREDEVKTILSFCSGHLMKDYDMKIINDFILACHDYISNSKNKDSMGNLKFVIEKSGYIQMAAKILRNDNADKIIESILNFDAGHEKKGKYYIVDSVPVNRNIVYNAFVSGEFAEEKLIEQSIFEPGISRPIIDQNLNEENKKQIVEECKKFYKTHELDYSSFEPTVRVHNITVSKSGIDESFKVKVLYSVDDAEIDDDTLIFYWHNMSIKFDMQYLHNSYIVDLYKRGIAVKPEDCKKLENISAVKEELLMQGQENGFVLTQENIDEYIALKCFISANYNAGVKQDQLLKLLSKGNDGLLLKVLMDDGFNSVYNSGLNVSGKEYGVKFQAALAVTRNMMEVLKGQDEYNFNGFSDIVSEFTKYYFKVLDIAGNIPYLNSSYKAIVEIAGGDQFEPKSFEDLFNLLQISRDNIEIFDDDVKSFSKFRFLRSIKGMVPNQKYYVAFNGHGDTYGYATGKFAAVGLDYINFISVRDLANSLIKAYKNGVNLSDVTLDLSTCYSYYSSRKLLTYLEKAGIDQKPVIYAAAGLENLYSYGGPNGANSMLALREYMTNNNKTGDLTLRDVILSQIHSVFSNPTLFFSNSETADEYKKMVKRVKKIYSTKNRGKEISDRIKPLILKFDFGQISFLKFVQGQLSSMKNPVYEMSMFSEEQSKILHDWAPVWEEVAFRALPALVAISNPILGGALFVALQVGFIVLHAVSRYNSQSSLQSLKKDLKTGGYSWAFEGGYLERTMAMISGKISEGKDKAVIIKEMTALLNKIKEMKDGTIEAEYLKNVEWFVAKAYEVYPKNFQNIDITLLEQKLTVLKDNIQNTLFENINVQDSAFSRHIQELISARETQTERLYLHGLYEFAVVADENKILNEYRRDLLEKIDQIIWMLRNIETVKKIIADNGYVEKYISEVQDEHVPAADSTKLESTQPKHQSGTTKKAITSTGLTTVSQVKNTLNPVGKVQKTAISIVIGKQALESLQKEEFNTKEVMLVINDSLKAEELRQEGLNVATAVAVQKDEKAKLKGSKKIGTAGTYNGAVVRAYWNSESKKLMFYSKSGLDGADIEQLKEMFANMQTEGLKSEAFKGINQIVVTDKGNYDETIKAMENSHTDSQSAIMIVKGIELDLTKRTGKINETICKNECSASGATIFVITEQQAAENSQNIEKMQKEGYKFIIKHASVIGAESVIYDGAKIDASGLQDYNQAIKLLEGLKTKALAKGGISIKFNENVYKMLSESGIDVWKQYGIIPAVNSDSAYIDGQIGRVEVEGITEQNIDFILSKDSVMTIVVDNTEILSDRKDAVKEAKTAKGKQKKEYKTVLNGNIPYAFNANSEAEIKGLINEVADIIEEDLTEEAKSADVDKRAKVISHIENIQQTSFYRSLNEKARSRIDHLMKDKDAVQKTAAFIRAVAMRTAEEQILSEMTKKGIDIKTEEFRKFQDGRFREGVLIRAVQLWLARQNIVELLSTEFIDSDSMTAEEYMNAIMSKAEGVASNIGAICINNEYTIRPEKDSAAAIAEFKEFNVLLQDRFRQIGIDKEVKVSVFAVKSILSAA